MSQSWNNYSLDEIAKAFDSGYHRGTADERERHELASDGSEITVRVMQAIIAILVVAVVVLLWGVKGCIGG